MKTLSISIIAIALSSAAACASSPPPSACGASAECAAAQPDARKARTHLMGHVHYPATRAQVLAACADTPEFTAAEKQWLADNLPEGNYPSGEDAITALKL